MHLTLTVSMAATFDRINILSAGEQVQGLPLHLSHSCCDSRQLDKKKGLMDRTIQGATLTYNLLSNRSIRPITTTVSISSADGQESWAESSAGWKSTVMRPAGNLKFSTAGSEQSKPQPNLFLLLELPTWSSKSSHETAHKELASQPWE